MTEGFTGIRPRRRFRPLLPSLYDTGFNPFLNLPREAIESLWLSYNLIGEGWALQVEDLQAIVGNASYLADKLGITAEHGTCPITIIIVTSYNHKFSYFMPLL